MDAHGSPEYSTAAGNDYEAHEATYKNFTFLILIGICYVISLSIGLAVGGVGALSLVIGQVAGWLVQSIGLWLVHPFRPGLVIARREVSSMMRFGHVSLRNGRPTSSGAARRITSKWKR